MFLVDRRYPEHDVSHIFALKRGGRHEEEGIESVLSTSFSMKGWGKEELVYGLNVGRGPQQCVGQELGKAVMEKASK